MNDALRQLGGIGPAVAAKLERMGITHPRDLLFHLPYRYQDRTRLSQIAGAQPGQDAVVLGRVELVNVLPRPRRMLLVRIRDASGALVLRFFHFSAAQQRAFRRGDWIHCYGEIRVASRGGAPEMVHPEYRLHTERPLRVTEDALTPLYPAGEGLGAATLRKLVARALESELADLRECLPDEVRRKFDLMPLADALRAVHRPPPQADTEALLGGAHPAQRRLALEELLAHHLALGEVRKRQRARNAPAFASTRGSWEKLECKLGFTLTAAQQRVIGEILADLREPTPAMRLLQGDVGSGKTVAAAAAALHAIDANFQAAMMAPTELLSEQHRRTFTDWFAPLNIKVEWLGGKMSAAARAQARQRIAGGEANMVIGTHALFQQQVEFHNLGLIIVDEQHRFGVGQRLALRNKAAPGDGDVSGGGELVPHQLIMSATPIPRSLAMIFYADLDVSAIDELPPGRKAVRTVALPNSRREEVAERIRATCRERGQAYWVCPLIDESDKLQAQAATETRAALGKLLPELRIDLLHGRMKPAQKDEAMRKFQRGETDLLVATTVVEVGVDVPAAGLMVIENAERLGLAQLHQLRGRVGRSDQQATCVLLYQPPLGKLAKERLGILRDTNDGFKIANKDLEQRGPGELLGTRQTGLQHLKVANLARDRALLPQIGEIANILRAQHPQAVAPLIERWIHQGEAYASV
ncbi:MAG: ATP-dependent DNA helicase RecG [Gammaproteobacteria bacterium]|nr:ATP-dependent DNA helicase RecG [Gammaproteobacteria bacterium]